MKKRIMVIASVTAACAAIAGFFLARRKRALADLKDPGDFFFGDGE